MKRSDHHHNKPKRHYHAGRPFFVPTPEQRTLVKVLSGLMVNWTEICKAIISPDTGKPITRKTLNKYFRVELDTGAAALRALTASKFIECLNEKQPFAVKLAMFNRFGWRDSGMPLPEVIGTSDTPSIAVTFHLPDKKSEPVDVTRPASPYEGQAPDLTRPALEPPRPRRETETGAIYEAPRGPSVFERPTKNGWMSE
jgi:hypothetical protein